ncbi:MAG TPA: ABC transporter permease [Ignavibacteria bacterium]|nr:ABC transporter permease [Ignavibacteria bacterium]
MKLLKIFIIKEFLQFMRDPKMFVVVLIAPVIQLIFLGYAANRDIKNSATVLFDQDKSSASREFIRGFNESGYFSIDYNVNSYDEMTKLIDDGKAFAGITIPFNFEKDISNKRTTDVQVIIDGSDGNKASITAGYILTISATFSKNISLESIEKSGMKTSLVSSIDPEVRVWYNPNLTTRNYFLPSIVGLVLIIITINMTSLAIVKEREIGTLEQLIVTPIKPYQLILGKLIPFSIIGFISVILVLSVMRFWFGIEVKGSLPFLFLSSFVFMLSTLGLGLYVSTISRTQQQAMITSAFLVIMPMIFLSGFSFPIENMPVIIQYITYLIPLKYFIIIIRGIVIKGLGFYDLWRETTVLFFMGLIILILSSMRFSKKLE